MWSFCLLLHCLLEQDPLKGPPKVFVEHGVDDGVERRVGVAEPEGKGEAPRLDAAHAFVFLALGADWTDGTERERVHACSRRLRKRED
jgi:hypothetical protein